MGERMIGLSIEEYEQRIRERAQQLWEEAGRPEGLSDHFWYAAQRAFEAEHPDLAQLHGNDPQPEPPDPLDTLVGDNS